MTTMNDPVWVPFYDGVAHKSYWQRMERADAVNRGAVGIKEITETPPAGTIVLADG